MFVFYANLILFCVGVGEHYFAMEQMSLYPQSDLIIVLITYFETNRLLLSLRP